MEDVKKVDNLQDKIRKFEKNTFNTNMDELKILFDQVLDCSSESNAHKRFWQKFTFDKKDEKKNPNDLAIILLAILNCDDQERIEYLIDDFTTKLSSKYKDKVLTRVEKIMEESCKKIDIIISNVNRFKKSLNNLKKPSSRGSYYGVRYTSVERDIDLLFFEIGKIDDFCDRVMKNYYELFA